VSVKWDDYYFPNEMMEQADAIENCMKVLGGTLEKTGLLMKDIDRVYIVGSGDCYFISFAAAYAFRKYAGIDASGYEAYDFCLMDPPADGKTAVLLFSSSGKSVYVIRALELASKKGAFTVGFTNHGESPLGQKSSAVIETVATGISKSFPTKTSTSGLALMYALAAETGIAKCRNEEECRKLLDELGHALPEAIRRIYKEDRPLIRESAPMFYESRCYEFAGSGPARTAAMIGAAKMIETSQQHPMSSNAEEFLHLIGFSIKSPDSVIVIGNNISDHREKQVVEETLEHRARAFVIGNVDVPDSPYTVKAAGHLKSLSPCCAVIGSMVVLHIFAAEQSRLAWKDPDAPHDVDLRKAIDRLYTGAVDGWNTEE
jgi:glucosamine 6-phosphate synthetase-like amidotransferase/phosphosugar isomerase protein